MGRPSDTLPLLDGQRARTEGQPENARPELEEVITAHPELAEAHTDYGTG